MVIPGQEPQPRVISRPNVRDAAARLDSENAPQNEAAKIPYGVNLGLSSSKLIYAGIVFVSFIISGVYTLFILGKGLIQPRESISISEISDILYFIVILFPKYESRAQEVLPTVFFLMQEGEKDKNKGKKEQPKSSIRPKLQRASQVLFSITTIMFFIRLVLDYLDFVPENDIVVNMIDFYPKSCMRMHLIVVIQEFFDALQITYNDILLDVLLSILSFFWSILAGNPSERQHGGTIFYLMIVLCIFYLLVSFYNDKEEDTRMRTFLYRVTGKAKMVADKFQVVVIKASPDWLQRLGHGSWNSLKRVLMSTTNMLQRTIQSEFTPRAIQSVRVTSISSGGVPLKRSPKESTFKKVVKFLSPFCQKVPYASFGAVIFYIMVYFVMRHIGKLE